MTAKTATAVIPYAARAFSPSHPDLALEAGVPAQLGNERYVEAEAQSEPPPVLTPARPSWTSRTPPI
jgi:hypothetical protein